MPGAVPCWEGPACDSMTLLFPQLSATLTIPFWQWFLTRFGKKTAVYVGISVSVPSGVGCTWGWSLPHGMGRAPPKEPRAGQGLLLMTIWCLSLLLLFVLSWMCPRMCSAAVGLGEGRCTSGSLAVPSVGGLGYAGGGEKPGGLGQALLMPTWSLPPLQSAIPFLIAVVVLDSSLFVTYVVAVAAGISVAAAFLLPW